MSSTVLKRFGVGDTGSSSATYDIDGEQEGERVGSLSTKHGYLPLTALGYRSQVRSLSVRTEMGGRSMAPTYDIGLQPIGR